MTTESFNALIDGQVRDAKRIASLERRLRNVARLAEEYAFKTVTLADWLYDETLYTTDGILSDVDDAWYEESLGRGESADAH